jgi:hypothetical protein
LRASICSHVLRPHSSLQERPSVDGRHGIEVASVVINPLDSSDCRGRVSNDDAFIGKVTEHFQYARRSCSRARHNIELQISLWFADLRGHNFGGSLAEVRGRNRISARRNTIEEHVGTLGSRGPQGRGPGGRGTAASSSSDRNDDDEKDRPNPLPSHRNSLRSPMGICLPLLGFPPSLRTGGDPTDNDGADPARRLQSRCGGGRARPQLKAWRLVTFHCPSCYPYETPLLFPTTDAGRASCTTASPGVGVTFLTWTPVIGSNPGGQRNSASSPLALP